MLTIEREMILAWAREIFSDKSGTPSLEPKTEVTVQRIASTSSLAAIAFAKVASQQDKWDNVFIAWASYRHSLTFGFPAVLSSLERIAVDSFHHAAIFESVVGSLIPAGDPSLVSDTKAPAEKCSACEKEAVANGLCEEHTAQYVEPGTLWLLSAVRAVWSHEPP